MKSKDKTYTTTVDLKIGIYPSTIEIKSYEKLSKSELRGFVASAIEQILTRFMVHGASVIKGFDNSLKMDIKPYENDEILRK